MDNDLTDFERESIQNFLRDGGNLKVALLKFMDRQRLTMESSSASALRAVPRQYELASDYAAKADVYRSFLAELERYSQH